MKRITFILIALIGLTTFAQKAEVKSAEKALKKGDLTTATEMIKKACKLKDQADDKIKAKIMYVKAQICAKKGSADLDNYNKALKTIDQLEAFEKQIGKEKYSDDAKKLKSEIEKQVVSIVNDNLKNKDYKKLSKSAMIAYAINNDEQFKYYAAVADLLTNNYEEAEKLLKELYDSGYTGEKEIITVLNKETNKRETVADEKMAKILVMGGTHTDMKKEKTKSARPDIIANLLFVYGKLGKDNEAIAFIEKAKKEDPNNLDLIIGEGNYYLKKGDNVKFAEAMQRAVDLDPNNKLINYNLATAYYQLGKYDDAKKYYEKTIELDPKYVDAYKGIAFIILAPEEGITKEMNKDEVLMNDALYNKYNNQRLDLYRKVLPVLEKALSISPDDQNLLVMLKKIYRDLDKKDKYKEVKAKLDAMKK
jgi:tetratricopeptide (TPR) repeat protein